MTVLLVLGLFVVIAAAHNITFLEVPPYGDPHKEASLVCHYVSQENDPPLHSVKWYRGNNEIFRYTPEQQPSTRIFNTTAAGVTRGFCDLSRCMINVVLPKIYNTKLSFTCEVSTEGPRFAVVRQTKNLTVAVILKEDPEIFGVSGSVQLGEDMRLNCTTKPAMPPANLMWFIDGKPEKTDPWMVNNTQVSGANEHGLLSSWRPLRLKVATANGYILLRCEATQPTWPPYTRSTNASLVVASPHLSMFTASGSCRIASPVFLLIAVCLMHRFSKYSALNGRGV